jgi:hypothetical protein
MSHNQSTSAAAVKAAISPASYDTPKAAIYVGVSQASLEKSRISGLLIGVKAPPYRRAGRKTLYLRSDLDAWLESLPVYQHSADELAQRRKEAS